MALLARLLRRRPCPTPDLTPDEEAYKVKTWRQVETLVGPALKVRIPPQVRQAFRPEYRHL